MLALPQPHHIDVRMEGLNCENRIWCNTPTSLFWVMFSSYYCYGMFAPFELIAFVWVERKFLEGKPNPFNLLCWPFNTHGYLFRFHLDGYLSRFSYIYRNHCWLIPTKADSQNAVGTEGCTWTEVWYQASSYLPRRVKRCYPSPHQAFQKQLATLKSLFSNENSCVKLATVKQRRGYWFFGTSIQLVFITVQQNCQYPS